MGKTKKSGITAKFGSRYGRKIRANYKNIVERMVKKHPCPKCGKVAVRRKGYALWGCSKCHALFAGGAYIPQTETGQIISRALQAGKIAEIVTEVAKVEEKKEEAKEEKKEE